MDASENSIESRPAKPGRKVWFWSVGSLALLAGLGVTFMTNVPPPPQAATPATAEADRVMRLHPTELVAVEPRNIEDSIKVSGTVYPAREAAIAAQVSGLAEIVAVWPGDTVAAGDLLVEVGTTDLQLQLDQQRATMATTMVQLQTAKSSLERTQVLVDKGLSAPTVLDAPRGEVDRLTATVAAQQTQVVLAETNLRRAGVKAPFGGTVASRTIEPGQVVSPGTTMLSLVDLSSVRVEVIVGLSHIGRVAPGQSVRLVVPGMEATPFTGTVDRISPIAETGTRSIKVHLSLDNPSGVLRGGMYVTGEIVVDQAEDVMAVPSTAVRTRDGESYVLAVVDGVLRERSIEAGDAWKNGALLEAKSGLNVGDIVVAKEMSGLVDGAPVMIEAK